MKDGAILVLHQDQAVKVLKAKKYALNEMQTFQTTLRNQLNLQDSKEACAGQLAHFRKKKKPLLNWIVIV